MKNITKVAKGAVAVFALIGIFWCLGKLGGILHKGSIEDFIHYEEIERIPNGSGYEVVLIQANSTGEANYWYYLLILEEDEEFTFDKPRQVPVLTFSDPIGFSYYWENEAEITVKYSNADIGQYTNNYRILFRGPKFSINLEKTESEPVAGGDATR